MQDLPCHGIRTTQARQHFKTCAPKVGSVHCIGTYRSQLSRLISEGVALVLEVEESEAVLQELKEEHRSNTHDVELTRQEDKVAQTKDALDKLTTRLGALPHTPVDMVVDIGPLKRWLEDHRKEFTALSAFCDMHKASASLEEGEVDPNIAYLWLAVKHIESRINKMDHIVNPKVFEVRLTRV